jgi:DNA-binding MarR family transcriptional regulator
MNIMTPTAATKHASQTRIDIAEVAETAAANCIATRVRQLSRIITRVYDDAMRPLGITMSQYTLLTQLAQQDDLDIEKSTLSRNLKRLLALGHLTMDPPAGRRGRGLHLTPKGQDVIQRGYPVWKDAQTRVVRVMGPESRGVLDTLLSQAERLGPA